MQAVGSKRAPAVTPQPKSSKALKGAAGNKVPPASAPPKVAPGKDKAGDKKQQADAGKQQPTKGTCGVQGRTWAYRHPVVQPC